MKRIYLITLVLLLTSCTFNLKNTVKIEEGKYAFSEKSFTFYKEIIIDDLYVNIVSTNVKDEKTTLVCKVTNNTFNITTTFSSNTDLILSYSIGDKVYPISDTYNIIFEIKSNDSIATISTRIQFFTSVKNGIQQTDGFRADIDYFKINNEKINDNEFFLPGAFYIEEE